MSDDSIVAVNRLTKSYSLRMKASAREAAKLLLDRRVRRRQSRRFFALRDITFEIARGEGFAIFGRNGSGKTTLLQLLANVMNPSSGSVEVRGSFTALLGATLGMMPNMTGIENIHLMAAMYGVDLHKNRDLLEEIIEFADIGEFIGTYVKNYSSGMKARIGFSVAVHIMPEIVFIDEVLRVGDIHFRQKCQDKLLELKAKGRTFAIVTHNEAAVTDICERALWIDAGELILEDSLQAVWEDYRKFRKMI